MRMQYPSIPQSMEKVLLFSVEERIKISIDGYEFEVIENAVKSLFDGSSKTYINFAQPGTFASSDFIDWSSTKTYSAGAYVRCF